MSGRPKRVMFLATMISVALVAVALAVGAAGCGGAPAGVVTVKMHGLEFVPQSISIKKGTTVRWVNDDQDVHNSTAAAWQDGKSDPLTWSSPLLNPGQTYERTFDAVGAFDYADLVHGYMTGTVTVTE
jgi:plastocyanin